MRINTVQYVESHIGYGGDAKDQFFVGKQSHTEPLLPQGSTDRGYQASPLPSPSIRSKIRTPHHHPTPSSTPLPLGILILHPLFILPIPFLLLLPLPLPVLLDLITNILDSTPRITSNPPS